MLDYFHIIVFIVAVIAGSISIAKIRLMAEEKNLKKYTLEKIFGIAFISLAWIIFGFYKNVSSVSLHFEIFAFCFLLITFLLKLNSSKSNKLFGKLIPGHGKAESKLAKKIKYILLYTILFIIILFLLYIFFA